MRSCLALWEPMVATWMISCGNLGNSINTWMLVNIWPTFFRLLESFQIFTVLDGETYVFFVENVLTYII